jgi:predicted Zn-dependent peptidase
MEFNKTVLDNGLIVLHEKREVPVTAVMIGSRFGSGFEAEKEKGIAHFLEHMAFMGTKKRTNEDISIGLEKMGGMYNAFTGNEETVFHIKLPSRHFKQGLEVLSDCYFNSVFPEDKISKEADAICEEIGMHHDTPIGHAIEKLEQGMYEAPFGLDGFGTREIVRSVTRSDLVRFHQKFYTPKNTILCVVGNNSFDEVLRLAREFCNGQEGEKLPKLEIKNRFLKSGEVRNGMQQAHVALGFNFPKTPDRDRYAAKVFSTILGYGSSSKLHIEVREKRGLAYAALAENETSKSYGRLFIYVGTEKKNIEEVTKICLDEVRKMANISEKELEEGKNQVIGQFEVKSESCEDVALKLWLEENAKGKAEDYYKYVDNVRKVTIEDIKKLADFKDYARFVLSA